MAKPMSPGHRKVLHYFGYVYPIIFIALGAAGLILLLTGVAGRTLEGRIVGALLSFAGIACPGVETAINQGKLIDDDAVLMSRALHLAVTEEGS